MDPDECLRLFREASRKAFEAKDSEEEAVYMIEAQHHAAELFEWLAIGGFAPKWDRES